MSNANVDKYQNKYLPHSRSETDLTCIINDIFIYLDNKAPCYLVLLYINSAFDTPNTILFPLDLIKLVYIVFHSWFIYFISSRTSSVKINSSLSPPYVNIHGVP